jgi:copper homeostasis protein
MIKEACVENISQAQIAFGRGATRVELCENLSVGGTTPSHGSVIWSKKHLSIPSMVMLRPRGGNFLYTKDEINTIIYDAQFLSEVGVDGIVTGFLTEKSMPDWHLIERIKKFTGDIPITFHKAIDLCKDIPECIRQGISTGMIQRFLTSGGAESAMDGHPILNQLIEMAGDSIEIVVAGKVTHQNLAKLRDLMPKARAFHGKKIVGELYH